MNLQTTLGIAADGAEQRLTRLAKLHLVANGLCSVEQEFGSELADAQGILEQYREQTRLLRDHRCPVFDRAASALIADLAARGLLEETLVVAVGEFGRSPRIGAPTTMNVGPGGRDHWPHCYSALVAGGGVAGGKIHGESDAQGAFPKTDPVHPFDLIATVYHALGIDPGLRFLDMLNRPRRLVDHGDPIFDLFSGRQCDDLRVL